MPDQALPWRPEFVDALRLFARVSDALSERGFPRPVLVGGGAVEFYSGSALMTGDLDVTSPAQSELEEELQRSGFVKPSGPGQLLKGWIHPDLGLGFEVVARTPMDGAPDATRFRLIQPDGENARFRIIAVEDLIADRMGQFTSGGGGSREMREQARILFELYPDADRDYLERRIRHETAGDYGIENIRD